jgi:hypothetical protein
MTTRIVSEETKALRLRLIALLSLYDLLPPCLEDNLDPDFDTLPGLNDATDIDVVLQSLTSIVQKLHVTGQAANPLLTFADIQHAFEQPTSPSKARSPADRDFAVRHSSLAG